MRRDATVLAEEFAGPVRRDCRSSVDRLEDAKQYRSASAASIRHAVQPRARALVAPAHEQSEAHVGHELWETAGGSAASLNNRAAGSGHRPRRRRCGRPKAEDIANRSKSAGADAVAGVARTAEALADTVAPDSPAIAEYVRGAGQKIDRLASDLRDKKVGDLLASAAEFGRSQPVIMLAGAALIGFALSRVVKAGVATPADTRTERQ